MMIEGVKTEQLEELLENLQAELDSTGHTANKYYRLKRQVSDIKEELKKRK